MRVLIQRVKNATVKINSEVYNNIGIGLLVFVGIENNDSEIDIEYLVKKIYGLRIFNNEKAVMNLSINDIDGEVLVVSQFTLHANTKKGNRPSYIKAAKPEVSIPLYKIFISQLDKLINKNIKTGKFGADMEVELINDGPVTIWIDSKIKE